MPKPSSAWTDEWTLGFRIWIEHSGRTVLGKGRVDLMNAIHRTNSISASAKEMGMSYRHAWGMVQEINERAGTPLIETAVGGKRGGGARLTDLGQEAVSFFEALRQEISKEAVRVLRKTLKKATKSNHQSMGEANLGNIVREILIE